MADMEDSCSFNAVNCEVPMNSFEAVMSDAWWAVLLRGIAAIVFGVITFLSPGVTLAALVLLFGAYALVDGVAAFILGIREYGERERWWAEIIVGLVGVAAGVITFLMPGITALALAVVIAIWAIVRGVFEISAAFRLRHAIEGEWLLGLAGVLSIAFGVLMLLYPGTGALALVLWIGAFAFVWGVTMFVLSFRVRRMARAVHA
jgi:uncharacterized membrane protein HdeD (DUF308 family)